MSSGGYLEAVDAIEGGDEFESRLSLIRAEVDAMPVRTGKQAKDKRRALKRLIELYGERQSLLTTLLAALKRLPREGEVNRDEFMESAMGPMMPDELALVLRKTNPEGDGFSVEGYEARLCVGADARVPAP